MDIANQYKTYERCKSVVERNGSCIYHIPSHFKTMEICELAVKNELWALKFVPEQHKTQELYEKIFETWKEDNKFKDILYLFPEDLRSKYQKFISDYQARNIKKYSSEHYEKCFKDLQEFLICEKKAPVNTIKNVLTF